MKITKAVSRKENGGGWILYGNRPDNGRWLERWFSRKEKAVQYAEKRYWAWEDSVN